jgi:arylsulfatase A-like enzyme
VHFADSALAELMKQLRSRERWRDALVVITGDHSFPTGEHGYAHNQVGFHEEVFRTPLLILWPGHLQPRRITGLAYSQVDIAPTLLELLGLRVDNHLVGTSILGGERAPVFLVQPYEGTHLGVVELPFKYVHSLRTGAEYLFDLARDPGEKENLADAATARAELEHLRRQSGMLVFNQMLLDQDRVWPGTPR